MNFRTVLWDYLTKDGTANLKIYVHIPGQGKRYYATQLHVAPKDWDEKKGLVKTSHPLAALYNATLKQMNNELETHFLTGGTLDNFKSGGAKDTGSLIKLAELVIGEAERGLLPLKPGTVKNYRATLKRMQQYCKHQDKSDLRFSDIDMDFYRQFSDWLEAHAACRVQGRAKHLKIVKRLMNIGLERGLHRSRGHQDAAFRIVKVRTSTKIYLNVEEIAAMERLDLRAQPALERERDRFLVSYYLLQRYSDTISLRRQFLFERGSARYVRLMQQKTNRECIIPLKPAAWALLERYGWDMNFSSNQQANRALKTIAALAGINETTLQDGRTLPKSQFVGTHTARRSAATNLYLGGASLKVIADLGGWENEETLRIYLRASGLETAILAEGMEFFR